MEDDRDKMGNIPEEFGFHHRLSHERFDQDIFVDVKHPDGRIETRLTEKGQALFAGLFGKGS